MDSEKHESESERLGMSIITIATSKGGAGKTTLAQVLLGTLTGEGKGVSAIDADYNQSLAKWIKTFAMSSIIVRSVIDEGKMIPTAQELETNHELVVIDTAGTPTQATVFAIGCADIVLIPCQLSSADIIEAIKTNDLVLSASKMVRREILSRVVLTDYQPFTNVAEHTEREVEAAGLTLSRARLNRLVGFKEMTFTGKIPDRGKGAAQVQSLISELRELGALEERNVA